MIIFSYNFHENLAPKALTIDRICQKFAIGSLAPNVHRRLIAAAQRQRTSRIRNRSAPHSNRLAFNYDRNIDYAEQSAVTIGAMSTTCPKCFARKWSDETNGMCCTASKVILPDTEERLEPVKSLSTSDHPYWTRRKLYAYF